MKLKLENGKYFSPKKNSLVECLIHRTKIKFGDMSPISQLALEEGLDVAADSTCLLVSK